MDIKRLLLGMVVVMLSACAGLELGGKMGIYGVSDRRETQDTQSHAKPIVCWWKQCDESGNVIQGS